ncbi:MAG: ATP-binding protein [Peptococcaceae bacterium]|jgi:predicted AAA+ superfamily ATPase|nr:ATP-binding protein [Peptococcaceae bacterium]MDH7524626.1 ATP-binding protein [Peptococcaceae bacterium]
MTEKMEKAIQAEWKVILYRSVVNDPLVVKFLSLLKETAKPQPDPSRALALYNDFTASFIPAAAEVSTGGRFAWPNYLLKLILLDENIFSRQAERFRLRDIPPQVKRMAEQDLQYLQSVSQVSGSLIREVLAGKIGRGFDVQNLPDWEGVYLNGKKETGGERRNRVIRRIHRLDSWRKALKLLGDYYRENGVGIFGQHYAFRWVHKNGDGMLVGVKNPDTIQLNQLYEYEREQSRIIQNTEQFLRGYPANNVLLYGDRGTGKSSTVKALVNLYGERGLRLIEVQKQDLADFPLVISLLAERPQRFILFVDDLSFTEQEGQYRELKALLEGGLEARPQNVLVYATSNRRHLVQERFSDREITGYDKEQDDVRYMDTMQEKLSLADRFGITVTFAAPDQKRYLAIVEKMARERGIDIPVEELHQRALKWEMSFNARSARTARQFVDFLEGQLALEADPGA